MPDSPELVQIKKLTRAVDALAQAQRAQVQAQRETLQVLQQLLNQVAALGPAGPDAPLGPQAVSVEQRWSNLHQARWTPQVRTVGRRTSDGMLDGGDRAWDVAEKEMLRFIAPEPILLPDRAVNEHAPRTIMTGDYVVIDYWDGGTRWSTGLAALEQWEA